MKNQVIPPAQRAGRHRRYWTLVALAALGVVVAVIVALNELRTVPRFEYAPANYAAVVGLAVSVPCLLVWLVLLTKATWRRWVLAAAVCLVSIPFLLFACLASFELVSVARRGTDWSFERIAELQSERVAYRLYRTNGGATDSFGLVLRRERPVVPGLKLVTVVERFYPASDATLEKLPAGLFRLTVAPYGNGDKEEVVEFRPED